jgi:hypothetical protein
MKVKREHSTIGFIAAGLMNIVGVVFSRLLILSFQI